MSTRTFGASLPRREDARLLTGQATFVDDIDLPGCLHAAVLRSPFAHARIRSIDTTAASAREGVVAVFTAAWTGPLQAERDRRAVLLALVHAHVPVVYSVTVHGSDEAEEFEILLTTGGPALRCGRSSCMKIPR
jgi:CO/xanthine dehydrogenase Mo-binding subunit